MPTISTLNKDGTLNMTRGAERTPYYAEVIIDLAEAAAAKGTALAVADVIETIVVPANTLIMFAGAQKITEMTGSSTDLTFDLGITGGNVDAYVDGWDFDAATVGAYAASPSSANEVTISSSASTIDLLFATQSGTVTGGKVRVFAVLADVSNKNKKPGIVQLGT